MDKINAVVFDFDGTLADTNSLIIGSWKAVLDYTGTIKTDDEILESFGETLYDTMDRWFPGRKDELVAVYRGYQKDKYFERLRAFPGMTDAVRELHGRGFKLGIATSRLGETLYASLEQFGILSCFDALVSCDDTKIHKPDPAPLLLTLSRMDARPENALFIGDSIVDMLCGRAAGSKVALVSWSLSAAAQRVSELAPPDYYINSAEELLGLPALSR